MNKFWLPSNLSGQNYSLAKDIADVRATVSFYSAHRLIIATQTSNVSWDISETHIGFNIRVDQFNKQTIFWVIILSRFDFSSSIFSIRDDQRSMQVMMNLWKSIGTFLMLKKN